MLVRTVKRLINQGLRRFGYQLRSVQDEIEKPFDLLGLAIRDFLATHDDLFFVQIGANDGVRSDGLRPHVVRHGLRGVLVEPLPDMFEALKLNYRDAEGLAFENSAVGAEEGTRALYRFPAEGDVPDWAHGLASFDRAHLERHRREIRREGKGDVEIREVEVPVITFPRLLEKHAVERVDLLQVDTEGFDYEVLRMAFAAGVLPPMLRYEHKHLGGGTKARCKRMLVEHGYEFICYASDTLAMKGA
jgi:FkbM family methyltransferase